MTHHIDDQRLRKAAEQLLTIDNAGYGLQFDREFHDLLNDDHRENSEHRCQQSLNLTLAGNAVDTLARRLSYFTQCPQNQAKGVALDLLGYSPRREIALELLAKMAGEVRKLQAQEARMRRAG